jgi:hypothetical protein
VVWIPASPSYDATYVELVVTRPGLESIELRRFVPATEGPLAHWFLPNGENFLALPRYAALAPSHRAAIVHAVEQITAKGPVPAETGPSLRTHLITAPLEGLGAAIETAWPCTVRSAP